MKFIKKAVAVAVLAIGAVCFSSSALARDYVEGKDYEIRNPNRTVEPEIREFFSFFCSHCFMMQEHFSKMKDHFKDQAKFVFNPIGMLGGQMGIDTQKAYAVAYNIGLEDEFKEELFSRIHTQDERPDGEAYYASLFEGLGVTKEDFSRLYSSFITQGKVSEYDRYTELYKIQAVPEIIVNGKYLVLTENLESEEDYYNVVAYLLSLEK
ncbi:MAG: DsbA family protein [Succinivibrio sp.]|nr:DsbA family protein [Succinivibrio sp.]MBR1613275.1 DsbA family protein [Succinivibrio sp.]